MVWTTARPSADRRGATRGPESTLGLVRLAEAEGADAASYWLHPALLDGCFHVLGAAPRLDSEERDQEQDAVFVPVGIQRVAVYARATTQVWCRARLRPAPRATTQMADLDLYDLSGNLVAQIEGLRLQRITRDTMRRAIGATNVRDWLHEVQWQPKARSLQTSANASRHVACSRRRGRNRRSVGRRAATERGEQCITVRASEGRCRSRAARPRSVRARPARASSVPVGPATPTPEAV